MKKDALYLVDGYSIIYRSYFAFINRPLTDSEGRNVSALFGFFRTLLSLFDNYNPQYFAVVMDSRVPTFRHEMYEPYKANREKAPDDLHAQIPFIEEVLTAMQVKVLRQDGVEADDIIATLARVCSEAERNCYIISGDKDLLQLVDDRVSMLRPENGKYRNIGPREVKNDYGIGAEQVIDYLSLMGDSADNIPGVKGIGPKTAVKLLQKYNTLDGIYEHLEECSKGEQKKLEEGRDSAYLSRELVVLHTADECPTDLEEFSLESINRKAAVPLLLKYGAKSLAEHAQGEALSQKQEQQVLEPGNQQSPGYAERGNYTTISTIDELEELVRKVQKAGRFAFDVETTSLNEMTADPVGFSIAYVTGQAAYIPLTAGGRKVLPEEEVKSVLTGLLQDSQLELVGHNFKYDYKVLSRWGIDVHNLSFDTMIAAWLLDTTTMSYGMDSLAEKHLGYKTIRYSDVVQKGNLFSDVELMSATEYAAEDADVTLRFYEVFAPRLKEMGFTSLFTKVEMPLVSILARMELRGIRLAAEPLQQYSKEMSRELEEIQQEIYSEVGYEFNISSTKQLQEVLFVERKLKPVKKTKTGYSTDLNVLQQLSEEDIVPQLVLRHRGISKLKSTYVDTLPELINEKTGRIHSRFIQTGTATGRLSSRDPNLQNIPIREEAGRRIRKAFVPQQGWKLISADYSQIELVVLAHLSGDPELQEAFRSGSDVHSRTGALIFGVDPQDVSSEQRRIAKTINFGVMYGMSGFRLSNELKIPRARADEFITAYFNRYAKIQEYIHKTVESTEKSGYSETMLGRRRYIPGINSRNRTEKNGAERIAVNT
ncbi:MAG: DNA polymerase I, partial [Spirochaetaceae bacterium]|nr:DNA polymerase I [Spirochaetaceae bacterium]MCF7947544.1 DNA polymerase I [Spirochaetia bacterium]MCF7950468.1 DNA polymerase I [Spirochaetaceae bacterium]